MTSTQCERNARMRVAMWQSAHGHNGRHASLSTYTFALYRLLNDPSWADNFAETGAAA